MASYQTVKMSSGAHQAGEGAGCFMEVVSMLNREEWSDRPECTCPAIAAFMRAFNDWLTDDERHLLWPYTTRVVGTNDGDHVIRAHWFAEFAYDVSQNDIAIDNAETAGANAAYSAREVGNVGRQAVIDKCLAFLDQILPEAPLPSDAEVEMLACTIPEKIEVPVAA